MVREAAMLPVFIEYGVKVNGLQKMEAFAA